MCHFDANYAALVHVELVFICCRRIKSRDLTFYFAFMPSTRNFGYHSLLVVFIYWHYLFRPNRRSSGVQLFVIKELLLTLMLFCSSYVVASDYY
jgi:hypothetical protein